MNAPAVPNDIRRDLVAILPRLRRFALTLTVEPSAADTLVREVCAKAIQKSHHWKGKGRLESWLFSLLRSAWADEARKRSRSDNGKSLGSGDVDREASAGPLTILHLPQGMASVLLLADVEGFSYAEGASILGVTAEAFSSCLCQARLHLSSMALELSERRA